MSGFFDSIHHATALYCIDTQLMELALKQGNVALARERLKHAVKYDNVEPNMIHVRNRYLQRYFEKVGDYERAYHYLEENHHIDDSIRNERVKMRAAEIKLKYTQDSTLMKKEISIRGKRRISTSALSMAVYDCGRRFPVGSCRFCHRVV